MILLDGSDFRDLIHQHAHLVRAVVNHHSDFRRCSCGGQSEQGADVHKGDHDPSEIGDSREDGRHAGYRRDGLDGKDFPDAPEVKGEESAGKGDEADA